MKTTINLNNYLTKGMLIMAVALSVHSLVSLHKSAQHEVASGSSLFNDRQGRPGRNLAVTAVSGNEKNNHEVSTNYVPVARKARKAAFIFDESLENDMISAAGLDRNTSSNVDGSWSSEDESLLENAITNAAGIYTVPATAENDLQDATLDATEQDMIRAAHIGYISGFASGSETDQLEQDMTRAAGLDHYLPVMPEESVSTYTDPQLEKMMIQAAGICDTPITRPSKEATELENMMIRAAGLNILAFAKE